jgi:hypothetical protein
MGFIKLTGRKHNCLYSWLKNIKRELYSSARSFKERSQFYFRNFDANPPIIVYQMGRVGSSTVYRSLINSNSYLKNPVYQVHFLSDEGIRNAEEYFLSLNPPLRAEHIERSKLLRKKMSKSRGRWKIITLVREPIARDISDFFQNVQKYYPHLIDSRGKIKREESIRHLQEMFMNYDPKTDYTCNWFDSELRPAFDIDVYNCPFNHALGFSIIRNETIDLLIMRLEDMNRCFTRALREFLGLKEPVSMKRSNISAEKPYQADYEYIKENIVLPKSVASTIFSTKYATHFYNERMRSKLIEKYS